MKKIVTILMMLTSLVFAQSSVSGDITSNTTWYANQEYVLAGQTFVKDGVTLTIEPGTVIKANSDDGNGLAPALVVERGGKLIADGTANAPITFTANVDESELPQRGLWGGIIILGNAPTNKGESFVEGLEGIPFGGDDPADDSGILRYVRVWYGGAVIGQDNEINGITFAGVGNGTVVEHCEVAYNLDDGFEFFGGTVNVKYLTAMFCGDDCFDTDEGYQGKGQFLFALLGTDVCGRGFEMDNNGSSMDVQPRSMPQFHNVTLIGPGSGTSPAGDGSDQMIRLREGTGGDFRNMIIAEGLGYGVRVSDQPSLDLVGTDSLNFDAANVIYNCAGDDFHGDVAGLGIWNAQNTNPEFRSLDGRETGTGMIDPRPGVGNSLLSSGVALPDDGFFTQASYVGAFEENLWISGWSILNDQNRLPANAIEDETVAVVKELSLNAYPNPFNPAAKIRFNLPASEKVKLTVFNLNGQQVKNLVSGQMSAGSHTVNFDGSQLATGIYFVRLQTPSETKMMRLTLLK